MAAKIYNLKGEPMRAKPKPAQQPEPAPSENDALIARFTPKKPSEFTAGLSAGWLIHGILPRAGLAVVYGESGSGKSFLVLDMVSALTRGVEWNGRRTQPCKVTYVCAEAAIGFKKRMRAYALKHDVSIDALPWIVADAPQFLEPTDPLALMRGVLDTGQKDIIVIDVLAAVMPGGNENSGEDMGMVLDHCKLLHQKTGALVLLITHTGKDATKGARGWSGLRAAADVELEVLRSGENRKFKVSKLKDSGDGELVRFKLEQVPLGRDENGDPESSCVVSYDVKVAASTQEGYQPKRGYERVIMQIVDESPGVAEFEVEDICAQVLARVPRAEDAKGRDQRGRSVAASVIKLGTHGLLEVIPGTNERRVRRSGPIRGDWLSE